MNSPSFRSRSPNKFARVVAAIAWLALVLAASREALAQTPAEDQSAATTTASDTATEPETKVPEAELDSLVAPIALYPDPLLSQTLVASTYPVELMQLQQWMGKNTGLKDQALADAVAKQPWDASIQGLATFPDVVEMLAGNIQWTSDLGNAFLAQQPDVMAAVQRMRFVVQPLGYKMSPLVHLDDRHSHLSEGNAVVSRNPSPPMGAGGTGRREASAFSSIQNEVRPCQMRSPGA